MSTLVFYPSDSPAYANDFQTLLRDLATCTVNAVTTTLNQAYSFTLVATPTPIQAQAFTLLNVDPTKLEPVAPHVQREFPP